MKKINSYLIFGVILIIIPVVFCIVAPILCPFDSSYVDSAVRLTAPNNVHLMGTDDLGRDIMARVAEGSRNSLEIGICVAIFTSILGLILGYLVSFYKILDGIIMRLLDGIMAFPAMIVAITLAGVLGTGKRNIMIALSISFFPVMTRIVRSAVLPLLEEEYVQLARIIGMSNFSVFVKHIMPNIIGPVLVQATYTFALAVLNESVLSFVGVGIKAPMASLGGMVNDAKNYMIVAPWIIMFPGLMISWLVLAFNMLGDGIKDSLS